MEFFAGMIVGGILTIGSYLGYKFYFKTEQKDTLLASELGKEFEEKLRLKKKGE